MGDKMAYPYGQVGIATALSSQVIGSGNYPVRVFDVCMVGTLGNAKLYDGKVQNEAKQYILADGNNPTFSSNAGIRFDNGLYVACNVSGATCTVSYVEER
jgi:hypothetical protein